MKRSRLLLPIVVIVLIAVAGVTWTVATSTKPQLGLDLQGGFSVVLQAKKVDGKTPPSDNVEKAKDIISQRVDGLGVAEPDITRQGRTVIVQLPGVKNRKKAESLVGCTARLEFRPVMATAPVTKPSTSSSTTTTEPKTTTTDESGLRSPGVAPGEGAAPAQLVPSTTTTAPPTTAAPTTTATTAPATTTTTTAPASDEGSAAGGSTSSCGGVTGKGKGAAVAPTESGEFPDDNGQLTYQLGPTGFTGDALSKAQAAIPQGQWVVNASIRGKDQTQANATFNDCNAKSATCPTGQVAIVLDGKVISAPVVNDPNLASDTFTISGGDNADAGFSEDEAKNLALVLRYGSLPVEFEQVALQQVSATLGSDSLRAGLIAGAIGVAAICLYMLLYYRGLGLVVIAGTVVWGSLMWTICCWLSESRGLALTLAGITGIIVSVGTTVDSYIVYFERIKDDLRDGRSVRTATERGFSRALRTIVTANVSSLIGAFLLWWLTVGPVRGFAFFLGISTLLDLCVIYFFARPLVTLMGRSSFFVDTRFFGISRLLGPVRSDAPSSPGGTSGSAAPAPAGGGGA